MKGRLPKSPELKCWSHIGLALCHFYKKNPNLKFLQIIEVNLCFEIAFFCPSFQKTHQTHILEIIFRCFECFSFLDFPCSDFPHLVLWPDLFIAAVYSLFHSVSPFIDFITSRARNI